LDEAFASEVPADPPDDQESNTSVSPDSMAEGMSDPGGQAQVRARQHILNATSRLRIDKRREELHRKADVVKNGPLGEKRSAILTERVEMVSLKCIHDDPNFTNLRLKAEEEELGELCESMRHEGLKVPITVIAVSDGALQFFVRAGFRRTTVARRLGWKKIPAVILPYNTPTIEEYWTNIIENSARSRLHTYEIASSARTMRDLFRVTPLDFSIRAGYSEKYVHNLLRCLDRLPEEVITAWREKAPIPVDLFIKWSIMEHSEALKMMLAYAGRNPQIVKDWEPPTKRHQPLLIRMASTRGLQRMQQVRFAVEVARQLDPATRALCIRLVDFCSGAREDVPGVYNPHKKQRVYKDRHRDTLQPLEPGELPPPPKLEPDEDDDKDNK
jgi:ParB/RepB/Spo0J family partition protein